MRAAHVVLLCAALWATAAGSEAYAHLHLDRSAPPTLDGLFWLMRSPLNYTYAMFVTGWVAGHRRRTLAAWSARHARRLAAAGAAAVPGFWLLAGLAPSTTFGAARMLYTLAVVAVIVLATAGRTAPSSVRFLSEASLGLYLYHHMVQLALAPLVVTWPPPLRIGVVAAGGLAGAVVLCLIGRRVLGRRSRLLLGA